MRAFHSDRFVLPLPAGHTFPMDKYRLLREAVAQAVPEIRVQEAPPATDGELALVHDPAWIGAVVEVATGPRSSTGSPSTLKMRPRVASPTGTEIGAPVSVAAMPRTRPSVLLIATARTR